TRFSRDWSSDVCSSDLATRPLPRVRRVYRRSRLLRRIVGGLQTVANAAQRGDLHIGTLQLLAQTVNDHFHGFDANEFGIAVGQRSEERRVGKECRVR